MEAFPNASEADLEILDKNVRSLKHIDQFYVKYGLSLRTLLDKIAGDVETEILKEIAPQHFCPCNKVRTLEVLATIPTEDLSELVKEEEDLNISCDYCRTRYIITTQEIIHIINKRNI